MHLNFSTFLAMILQNHAVILSTVSVCFSRVKFQDVIMHGTDAARLNRRVPQITKSHQIECEVNGQFMQEIR